MEIIKGHKPKAMKRVLEDYLWSRCIGVDNIIVHYYTDFDDYLQVEVEYWFPDKIIFEREFIRGR